MGQQSGYLLKILLYTRYMGFWGDTWVFGFSIWVECQLHSGEILTKIFWVLPKTPIFEYVPNPSLGTTHTWLKLASRLPFNVIIQGYWDLRLQIAKILMQLGWFFFLNIVGHYELGHYFFLSFRTVHCVL